MNILGKYFMLYKLNGLLILMFLALSFTVKAQELRVYNDQGQIIDKVVLGHVVYSLKDSRTIYSDEVTRMSIDTIFFGDGYILLKDLSFINQIESFYKTGFNTCTYLNYSLIPIQYGIPLLILAKTEGIYESDVVYAGLLTFFITQTVRWLAIQVRNGLHISAYKREQRNCTYKIIIP